MTQCDFELIRQIRANEPAAIERALFDRERRALLGSDNKLFILAADHPARGALGVHGRPMVMADRYELLSRLVDGLQHPGVDGFLGTPDLIEDLTLMGALDGKLVVGSMNRSGLHSSIFEMDDRVTAYDIDSIVSKRLDFAKLLLRINLDDAASVRTIELAATVVSRAAVLKVPIMIEPFMSTWVGGSIRNDLSTDAVIKSVAIAGALGSSSAYTWLKLPVVPNMERVLRATTLPTLLLGGDLGRDPDSIYDDWERALLLPGVHGLVAGRALLYPLDGDVGAAVDRAARLVHQSIVN